MSHNGISGQDLAPTIRGGLALAAVIMVATGASLWTRPAPATCPLEAAGDLASIILVRPAHAAKCPYMVTDSKHIAELGTHQANTAELKKTTEDQEKVIQKTSDALGERGAGEMEKLAKLATAAAGVAMEVANGNLQGPAMMTGLAKAATTIDPEAAKAIKTMGLAASFVQTYFVRGNEISNFSDTRDRTARRVALAHDMARDAYAIALSAQASAAKAPQRANALAELGDKATTIRAQRAATTWAAIQMLQELQANRVVETAELQQLAAILIAEGALDAPTTVDATPFNRQSP